MELFSPEDLPGHSGLDGVAQHLPCEVRAQFVAAHRPADGALDSRTPDDRDASPLAVPVAKPLR